MSIYDYIKTKEGFRDTVYDDVGGVPTIGYGRTGGSFEPTTMEAEDAWLKQRVDSDREYVKNYANKHGYDWSPAQIDALTSFTYNLGKGGLNQLTQGGQRDNALIGQKILEYNKAGGETQPGLVTRRQEESAMFTGVQGGVPHETFRGPRRDVPRPQLSVPQPSNEPSFGRAFSDARAAHGGGGGTFEWKGNFYTTDLKEEQDMKKYNIGTPMVPPIYGIPGPVQGYRRGSDKIVDEAERLRREEARLTNNTSGGRNDPRGVAPVPELGILNDPYAEPRFFGPAQGYDNDPVTGELIDDPANRFGGVPSAPVEEEPGWWARQFAPLKGSLTRSWEERHPPAGPTYPDQAPPGFIAHPNESPMAGQDIAPPLPTWTSPKGEKLGITPEGYLVNQETGAAGHPLDQQLFTAANEKQKAEQNLIGLQNEAEQQAAAGNFTPELTNQIREEQIKLNFHTQQLANVQEGIVQPVLNEQAEIQDQYQDYKNTAEGLGLPAVPEEQWLQDPGTPQIPPELNIDTSVVEQPTSSIEETQVVVPEETEEGAPPLTEDQARADAEQIDAWLASPDARSIDEVATNINNANQIVTDRIKRRS